MELTISILAFIVSFATFLFSVLVTYRGEQREKTSNSFIQLMRLKDSTGSCVKSPKAGLSFQAMTAS